MARLSAVFSKQVVAGMEHSADSPMHHQLLLRVPRVAMWSMPSIATSGGAVPTADGKTKTRLGLVYNLEFYIKF